MSSERLIPGRLSHQQKHVTLNVPIDRHDDVQSKQACDAGATRETRRQKIRGGSGVLRRYLPQRVLKGLGRLAP